MSIRYKTSNSKRRYESDWMQDKKSDALEEHPAQAISRTLRSDYGDLFDTISVEDDIGKTVRAYVDDGGGEVSFYVNGNYAVGYVKLPVLGKPCRTQKDVDALVSEVIQFLERHQSF